MVKNVVAFPPGTTAPKTRFRQRLPKERAPARRSGIPDLRLQIPISFPCARVTLGRIDYKQLFQAAAFTLGVGWGTMSGPQLAPA
jgi:hypothetical protein